jgi:porphobilinogen synthase
MNNHRILKKNSSILNLTTEYRLHASDFIYPIFVCGNQSQACEIDGMPEISRISLDSINYEIETLLNLGISNIMLFPYIPNQDKDTTGSIALDQNGLIPKTIKIIKNQFHNNVNLIADIALDPYTSHGHDGILTNDGLQIDNNKTLEILTEQAIILAEAGADFVAPSDMMSGTTNSIRLSLDKNNFNDIGIFSYSIKFASSLYSPFRNGIGSGIKSGPKDKSSYQANFANNFKTLARKAIDDISSGADAIIVKPASFYLDIINQASNTFTCPIFGYQVSGEYNMIKKYCLEMQDNSLAIESLIAIKRSGATAIISYFAKEIAQYLQNKK